MKKFNDEELNKILEELKLVLEHYKKSDHEYYLKTLGELEKMLRKCQGEEQ